MIARRLIAAAAFASMAACAAAPADQTATPTDTAPAAASASAPGASHASILHWSRPTNGATVDGPVNELQMHFSPPARLHEVTLTGPQGMMPTMVSAAGEVEHYSIPLSGVEAGNYMVAWRATAAGTEHRGTFAFTVR
jgi:methionine-rich copper-binding protein CopC